MQTVLFICVGNSGRSQMAEAFFNHLAGGRAISCSAGTQPAERVDPHVILVMREVGIDIAAQVPKALTPGMLEQVHRVISMGCGVDGNCLASPVSVEDWGIKDPKGKSLEEIRAVRDMIRVRVLALLEEIEQPGFSRPKD
ncbi:arsenate reductase ArsC [Dehalococcoidia bacterium]|nr:arsenate reductase ArsC [Dehalococcoidia bacterium]